VRFFGSSFAGGPAAQVYENFFLNWTSGVLAKSVGFHKRPAS